MLEVVPTIGENIRRLRQAAGFQTQSAFAEHLGVKQPQVSDWENDRYGQPDTKTLKRIATALNKTMNDLIEGTEIDPGRDINDKTSAAATELHDGAVTLPTHSDLYDELTAASRDFLHLSLLCRTWYERLADLAGDITRGQAPSPRADRPLSDDGAGTSRQSNARPRTRRRKAG